MKKIIALSLAALFISTSAHADVTSISQPPLAFSAPNTIDDVPCVSYTYVINLDTNAQFLQTGCNDSDIFDFTNRLITPLLPVDSAHISDATTLGKALLTASSQSAARTAIGAGTSSFSGNYTDLSGKPTIPTALSGFTNDTGFITSSALSSYATTASVTSGLATKQATITTGTTAQYLRGDLSLATFPTIPTNTNQLTNGANFITSSGAPVQSVNGQTGAVTLSIPSAPAFATSSMTLSLTGTGATGTQISATKEAVARLTYSTQVSITLGGSPSSVVILKTCATNSATESDWVEVGRTAQAQPTTLTVTVGGVYSSTGQITAEVPAGYYIKAEASGAGTHTEAFVSGQKTIYN